MKKYDVYFENSRGVERKISEEPLGEVQCYKLIGEFCLERNFISHYSRAWGVEGGIKVDVGSHTEFFILREKEGVCDITGMLSPLGKYSMEELKVVYLNLDNKEKDFDNVEIGDLSKKMVKEMKELYGNSFRFDTLYVQLAHYFALKYIEGVKKSD